MIREQRKDGMHGSTRQLLLVLRGQTGPLKRCVKPWLVEWTGNFQSRKQNTVRTTESESVIYISSSCPFSKPVEHYECIMNTYGTSNTNWAGLSQITNDTLNKRILLQASTSLQLAGEWEGPRMSCWRDMRGSTIGVWNIHSDGSTVWRITNQSYIIFLDTQVYGLNWILNSVYPNGFDVNDK